MEKVFGKASPVNGLYEVLMADQAWHDFVDCLMVLLNLASGNMTATDLDANEVFAHFQSEKTFSAEEMASFRLDYARPDTDILDSYSGCLGVSIRIEALSDASLSVLASKIGGQPRAIYTGSGDIICIHGLQPLMVILLSAVWKYRIDNG